MLYEVITALIHYSPRYADQELRVLQDEAREIFPETVLSKDRMRFSLDYED